jgi:hypothetical protein
VAALPLLAALSMACACHSWNFTTASEAAASAGIHSDSNGMIQQRHTGEAKEEHCKARACCAH